MYADFILKYIACTHRVVQMQYSQIHRTLQRNQCAKLWHRRDQTSQLL